MSEKSIEVKITNLIELCTALKDVLAKERQCLADRDLEVLAQATQAKTALCAQIDAAVASLGPAPISEQLANLDPAEADAVRPLHSTLIALAQANRDYNAANGKIVHRSQQSVRELINMLSGSEAEVLYQQSGQTTVRSSGAAIAKA